MGEESYSIVYRGEVLPGHTPEAVKSAFTQQFRISGSTLKSLFSGKPVVLKKGLDRPAAEKYFRALHGLGAKCSVRRSAGEAVAAAVPPQPQPARVMEAIPAPRVSPARPIEPPAAAGALTCPKCGHRQTSGAECEKCGVIFGKMLQDERGRHRAPVDPRQSAKAVEQAKSFQGGNETRKGVDMLLSHVAQHPDDWRADATIAELLVNEHKKSKRWKERADEHLARARENGGGRDPEVLALSARVALKQLKDVESRKFADEARNAYRELSLKTTDEARRQDIAKQIDQLIINYKLPKDWLVYDADGNLVLQTGDVKEIHRGLKEGSIPADAVAERSRRGIRQPLAAALDGASAAIDFMLRPARRIGIIVAVTAGVVGLVLLFMVGLEWALQFLVDGTGWYFQTLKDMFVYQVLFFLPYFKVLLVWCLIVGMVPLAGGFIAGGLLGYPASYLLGLLLSPLLPKAKWRRTA